VTFRLATPNKFDLLLKVPLVLAIVLVIIYEYVNPTIAKISQVSGLSAQHVHALIKRGTGKEFPLLSLGSDDKTRFNPSFETRRKKLFIVHPGFSLRKPPKMETQSGSGESGVTLKYQSYIARILKDVRSVSAAKLEHEVEAEFTRHGFSFNKDEYGRALVYLEATKYIRRHPSRPGQYLYVE
jgi:hypothetical protein